MKARCVLALLLAVLLTCSALPVTAQTQVISLEAGDVSSVRYGDVVVVYKNRTYTLAKPDGTPLSEAYDGISDNSYSRLLTVHALTSEDGIHREGLIDLQGQIVVPPVYGDTSVVSDRWQLGFKLKESNEESVDYTVNNYSTGKKTYYLIDTVDVYYCGTLAGTLPRTAYYSATAHGDYLCVRGWGDSASYTYYNKALEPSPYTATYSSEYDDVYKDGTYTYYHQGTGVQAFCPECPLTEDEVEQRYMVSKGKVYDLQGNVLCQLKQNYDSIRDLYADRYATVKLYGKAGVVDLLTGEEIIPLEYDSIDSYYYDTTTGDGYACAEKDGKVGFVHKGGQVTCDFVYASSSARTYGLFAYVNDPAGGVIVLSAAAGILPQRYAEVTMRDGGRAFVAEDDQKREAVIGLNGQELVPFGDARYVYVNLDGTVATGRVESGLYNVWTMDYNDTLAGVDALLQKDPAPEQTADDTWTCSNGHAGNTGKFCTECGEPRPQEPAPAAEVTCPGCGKVFPAEEAPKFCPECGSKL